MYYGERLNSMTHFLGVVLAAVSGVLLIALAVQNGDPWKIVSFSIYVSVLLIMYSTSTIYHSVRGAVKNRLRKLDHCAIYLLIAGSYTPFTLVTLRGVWGWSMFSIVWVLALFGIAQEIWYAKGRRVLSLIIYIMMGWLAVIGVRPLIEALGLNGFLCLLAGGLFYTVGIVFYATDHKIRHGHGIWHIFVLGGSICHFLTILFFVA